MKKIALIAGLVMITTFVVLAGANSYANVSEKCNSEWQKWFSKDSVRHNSYSKTDLFFHYK